MQLHRGCLLAHLINRLPTAPFLTHLLFHKTRFRHATVTAVEHTACHVQAVLLTSSRWKALHLPCCLGQCVVGCGTRLCQWICVPFHVFPLNSDRPHMGADAYMAMATDPKTSAARVLPPGSVAAHCKCCHSGTLGHVRPSEGIVKQADGLYVVLNVWLPSYTCDCAQADTHGGGCVIGCA